MNPFADSYVDDSNFMQQIDFSDLSLAMDGSMSSIPPHLVDMLSTMNMSDIASILPNASVGSENVGVIAATVNHQQPHMTTSAYYPQAANTVSSIDLSADISYQPNLETQMLQLVQQQHQQQQHQEHSHLRPVYEYHQRVHEAQQLQRKQLVQQQQQQYSYPPMMIPTQYQKIHVNPPHQTGAQLPTEYQQQERIAEDLCATTTSTNKPFSPVYTQSLPSLVTSPTNTSSSRSIKNVKDNFVSTLTKKVELLLDINREIIRLFLIHQDERNYDAIKEPNLSIYASRLELNLTYLATLADLATHINHSEISMLQSLSPPDLTPLPYAFTPIGQKIGLLFEELRCLFREDPSVMDYAYVVPQPSATVTTGEALHVPPFINEDRIGTLPTSKSNSLRIVGQQQAHPMPRHQSNEMNWIVPYYDMQYLNNSALNSNNPFPSL